MSKELYLSKNPVVEGHFRVDCLDKDNNVVDTFEDHNMIMLTARRSMAELFFNMVGNKHAHKIVLGTHGSKDLQSFRAKDEEDGFVKERTHIFSEVPDTIFVFGTLFEEIYTGDIIKLQDMSNISKYNYWRYNGEYQKNFVIDEVTIEQFTKLDYAPYTYTINFNMTGLDMGDSDSCTVANPATPQANDMVRVQLQDTSVIFTFYVDVNNGNEQEHNDDDFDSPTSLFNEAGLYVNDRLFAMKTFSTKVKDESVKLRIVWTITF